MDCSAAVWRSCSTTAIAARPAAVNATEISPGGHAADIGFGGGLGLGLLLERVGNNGLVQGVEIADDVLTRARLRFAQDVQAGRLRLAHGSLTNLPLDDDSLDAVTTVNTIYFVPELEAACAELARVLRPGGRAVVGVGDPHAMARLPITPHGFTLRPIADVVAVLQDSGLESVEQRRVDDVAIPTHLLAARR
jgi:arsenite methyltransferase